MCKVPVVCKAGFVLSGAQKISKANNADLPFVGLLLRPPQRGENCETEEWALLISVVSEFSK